MVSEPLPLIVSPTYAHHIVLSETHYREQDTNLCASGSEVGANDPEEEEERDQGHEKHALCHQRHHEDHTYTHRDIQRHTETSTKGGAKVEYGNMEKQHSE